MYTLIVYFLTECGGSFAVKLIDDPAPFYINDFTFSSSDLD